MSTIPSLFSDAFQNELFGIVTGTVAATPFPSLPAKLARLHARGSNTGPFYLGDDSTGPAFSLSPGENTDWFSVPKGNLNHYRHQCLSGTNNRLEYWTQF
jgi:hypothetical protein